MVGKWVRGSRWYEHQEPLGSTGNGDARPTGQRSASRRPRHRADASSCLAVWMLSLCPIPDPASRRLR